MIICADRILAGDRSAVIEDGAVFVENRLIKKVGRYEDVSAAYPDEPAERYPGASLMPGMIDLHVHLAIMQNPAYANSYNGVSLRALYATAQMARMLAAGVTTVRDSASGDGIGPALKQAAADGYIKAPRIYTCLDGICMTGGHGTTASTRNAVIEADGVDEIRKAVRLNLKRGADCIKILTSEGTRGQELSQEELNAAVEEAHRFGVKIAAHAGYGDSIEMCIKAGFDSIEHGTHLTREQAVRMKAHNITWVPTVFIYNYAFEQYKDAGAYAGPPDKKAAYIKAAAEIYSNHVKALFDTGVRVATGTDTDCIEYRGAPALAMECASLVQCGLTPLEAIECATKNGADYLGCGDRLGQIKEGYVADVIFVDGNPAENIDALTKVIAVFQSGSKVSG